MKEKEVMQDYLDNHDCPYCENRSMKLLGRDDSLWDWRCNSCNRGGNVGYDIHELTIIDFPLDIEKELESAKDDYMKVIEKYGVKTFSELIRKVGIPRPKKHILLNQDPSLY